MQGDKKPFIDFLKKKSGLNFSLVDIVDSPEIKQDSSVSDENRLINALKEKINEENLVKFDFEEKLVDKNKKIIKQIQSDILSAPVKKHHELNLPSFNLGFASRFLATSFVAVSVVVLFVSVFASGIMVKTDREKVSIQNEKARVQNFILENTRQDGQRGVVAGASEEKTIEKKSNIKEILINSLNLPSLLKNSLGELFK